VQIDGVEPGMLLDSITLHDFAGGDSLFYQPEVDLNVFKGEDALGEWKLEMWDTRAGATNPLPILTAWQLRFIYQTTVPVPIPLTFGVQASNTIPAGGIAYFSVDVPGWARFATNTLVSASPGPVNLLFNQYVLPTGTNVGDFTLLSGATSGIGTPIL